jgi:hypothetical protein
MINQKKIVEQGGLLSRKIVNLTALLNDNNCVFDSVLGMSGLKILQILRLTKTQKPFFDNNCTFASRKNVRNPVCIAPATNNTNYALKLSM